jgi:RNA polymerase sigma-70 factor (ECF subfamily)
VEDRSLQELDRPPPREAEGVPPARSDAELILAVVERDDRRAYATLVERHQGQVRSVLRRLTKGDAALADDLAQDTFVLAWRNLKRFRFESRFSTWLYRIAFNAWQSEARRKRELLLDDETAGEDSAANSCEMPDIVARVDLERAMATLSEGERAAVAACYYADLSHEEAAAALGMPLGTVKTHVLRAKAKLRARLAPRKDEK